MNLKGKVTISRLQGGNEEFPISIQIEDDQARCRFVDVRISLKDFAEALTGKGRCDCVFETYNLNKVGTVGENKTETIQSNHPFGDKRKLAALEAKVAALEVDGWKHRQGDLTNHHNYTSDGVRVVFFRNIPAKEAL